MLQPHSTVCGGGPAPVQVARLKVVTGPGERPGQSPEVRAVPTPCGAALEVLAFVYLSHSNPSVRVKARRGSELRVADLECGTQS